MTKAEPINIFQRARALQCTQHVALSVHVHQLQDISVVNYLAIIIAFEIIQHGLGVRTNTEESVGAYKGFASCYTSTPGHLTVLSPSQSITICSALLLAPYTRPSTCL